MLNTTRISLGYAKIAPRAIAKPFENYIESE
jgi:hypothetical protein